ncbi:hypothetical protein EOM82_05780 [bacterium]|nr:hypothetical protein [bacterium]
MADYYSAEKGKSWWVDANQTPANISPTASENSVEAQAAGNVTKPTVVQPFVVVPYVSQMQPLYQYDYSQMNQARSQQAYGYSDMQGDDHLDSSSEKSEGSDSAVVKSKIAAIIFALLSIAVIVIGRFVSTEFLYIANNVSGINILLAMPEILKNGAIMDNLFSVAFAGAALFILLIFIFGIIGVKRESKVLLIILGALELVCCLACIVFLMQEQTAIALGRDVTIIEGIKNFSILGKLQYGIYILSGLALINLITVSIGQASSDRE